jgi:DNA-binding PadR family transcriptional regulator
MVDFPLRNIVYEKIKSATSMTDEELTRALSKTGTTITPDRLNKILLDLEIMGLIRVSWLTKDTRRIEVVVTEVEEDEYDEQNKEMMEKDYEASFPGLEES